MANNNNQPFDELARIMASKTVDQFKRRGNFDILKDQVESLKKLHKLYDDLGQKYENLDRLSRRSSAGRALAGDRERVAREIRRHPTGYMSEVFNYASESDLPASSFADLERNYRYKQRAGRERVLGNKSNYYWRQIGLAGAHAISGPINQLAQQVPVVGQAIGAGIGSTANMLGLGASLGSALKLGGFASLAAGGAAYVGHAYQGFQREESLKRDLSRIGGLGGANSAAAELRKQGFLSSEIEGLASSYGRATGHFRGVGTVGRYDQLYGVGGGLTSLAGMMSGSGARGDQTKFMRDAIASGVVQGLERGRMPELIDGIARVAGANPLGVGLSSEGLGAFSNTAGMIGRMTGMRGSQLYQILGGFDATTRGHGNALQQSAGFLTSYNYLNETPMGAGGFMSGAHTAGALLQPNLIDIFRLQDRGTTGDGGMGLKKSFESQMRLWMSTTGLTQRDFAKMRDGTGPEADAAKRRFDLTAFMINEGSLGGSSINAATKLLNGFMGGSGSLSQQDIDAAMKDARPVEDRQYEEIKTQTDIQRRIQFNTEAIGRLSPGGENFNKAVEWAAGSVAGMLGGEYKGFKSYDERVSDIRGSAQDQFGRQLTQNRAYSYNPATDGYVDALDFSNEGIGGANALSQNKLRRVGAIARGQFDLISQNKNSFGSEAQYADQMALWKGLSAAYGDGKEGATGQERLEMMRKVFSEDLKGNADERAETLARRLGLAEVFVDIMRRGAETFVAGLANPNSSTSVDTQRLFPGIRSLEEVNASFDRSSMPRTE